MDMAYGILAFYGALALWAALLIYGFIRGSYGPFLAAGIGLLVILNGRYFVDGATNSIAFFIGIYDVLDNLGVSDSEGAAALSTCPDNACTVWGNRYQNHPSWGTAFYDRFANGSQGRRNLLYGHIGFNSIAFVLMHIQLLRPGTGGNRARHRLIGRIGFLSLTISTIAAVWLAAGHGSVGEYGGNWSMVGFWFMASCVYSCALMGIATVRRGDTAGHRKWMIRYAGSMWGAFWLFRVMLFVLGPLLRNFESANILICIWFSAPLGIAIAEFYRRRSVRVSESPGVAVAAAPLTAVR